MNLEKDKEAIRNMTIDQLQEGLAMLEFDRMQAEHYVKANELQYILILIDVICGELINRNPVVRNDKEPRWSGPTCPDTFYQLMSLGDGSVL